MHTKNPRSLMVWLTLFFIWNALVLWYHGVTLLKFIMTDSMLYAFSASVRTASSELLPDTIPVVLLMMMVLAASAVLATLTVFMAGILAGLLRNTVALIQARYHRALSC